MSKPLQILQTYWKHNSFRPLQEEIIHAVLEGKDTFALLPTSGGKSICYQIPGMQMEGICLVISPLIALIKDQVQNLQNKGIKAISLLGGIPQNETIDLLDNCEFGNYKFLYLSPERMQQDWIVERLKRLPINLIAIDEAHCVSQWGHDFRPSYLKIKDLKNHFPKVPFLALTASATQRVQEDIIEHLALENPVRFQKSFERSNLAYHVIETEDKLYKVRQILSKNPQSSIIYVRNRKSCLEIAGQLQSLGLKSTYFHGGLPAKEKESNMQLWLENKVQVMVATNAFGMGIDKPDVKTVIHIQLPESLENYYQEAGRAGRNGEKAFGILLVSVGDIEIAKKQFLSSLPDKDFLKEIYSKLNNYFQIAYGEGYNETFNFNLNQFCSQYNFPVLKTFNALQYLDRQAVITLQNEYSEKVSLQFTVPSKEVIRYMSLHPKSEEIITSILRTYPGIFEIETLINISLVAKKSGSNEKEVLKTITDLEKSNTIILHIQNNDSKITFNEVREDALTINRISKPLEKQNEIKVNQLKSVINFISKDQCKSRILLQYFDEKKTKECGICSYCVSQKNKISEESISKILSLLQNEPLSSREIENRLDKTTEEIIFAIQTLLENNKIAINTYNQYYILEWKN
ncbi:RecQ family ATP-dependent DNA helicase [Flavobacterium sp. TP390]|uniref:ATP-dependent DNA helicase RecQ n=1 Tax=Flavobacterium profundi TaxID=1774945 RepID=A0A6I4ILF4_9FLAO|nr:ATP-dependent DNA helicase RecQ [Flavobacterium profundi]MVO09162.1 RecQ family ATP-dependent DNA helicase [Flavobacterium profundi]